jgi:hypothetical protein
MNKDPGSSREIPQYWTITVGLTDPRIAGGVPVMTGIAISNEVTTVGETTVKTVTVVSIEVKSSDAHLMMVGVEVKIVTVKLTSAESPRARGLESQNSPLTVPRIMHQPLKRRRSSNGRRVDHLRRNATGQRSR